jgi:hypothetical protein
MKAKLKMKFRPRKLASMPEHRVDAKNVAVVLGMKVGDVVEVENRSVANSLYIAARRRGMKLSSRSLSNGRVAVQRSK